MLKALLIGSMILATVPIASAQAYRDGYGGYEDCGPHCQARRNEHRREEEWRRRHREHEYDRRGYFPPPHRY